MLNLHEDFLSRMKALLGNDYDAFYKSLQQDEQKAIYVNTNKTTLENFKNVVDFSITNIPYEENGFYVDNEKRGRHALHHAGAFYIQEPSAMFTVNSYKFRGDEKVLDMCAAPGGKTIQIATRIPNGVLVSNEFNKSRSSILYSNVERMGLTNVIITNESSENLAKAYEDTFDVCLVDAPCSGEGMFRRGEEVVKEWNVNLPKMCAERQLEILDNADKVLKQGGILIYSTCTYSLEENEGVVKEFCNNYCYEILNIEAPFSRGIGLEQAVRLYPHVVKGEGQFVAVLRKTKENDLSAKQSLKLKDCINALNFMKKHAKINKITEKYKNFEKSIKKYGNCSYYVPEQSLIKKDVNYVSIGVKLGEDVNGRFEPNHYLFSAFGGEMNLKLNLRLTDNRVAKYLKGETLDVDFDDGYGAVLVENCALGGFKISKEKFKNHYPKGLRNYK